MKNRGVILILCYMVIMVLTILGAAFFVRSVSERNVSTSYYNATQALWLAEAGIQQSLWELNHNNCAGCAPCGTDRCVAGAFVIAVGTGTQSGTYNTTIFQGNTGLISTGAFPNPNPVQRTIRVDLGFPSVFQYAIFCHDTIAFTNSASTDSYDSSKGLYNALLPDGSRNIGSEGSVGTDSTAARAITLQNSATVNGDAGVGGDPATGIVTSNTSQITGSRTGGVNIPFPSVPVPPTPAGGWQALSGSSLSSGSYTATSLALNNKNPTLNINGDVTLYITGDMSFNQFSSLNINAGGKLTIYVNGTFSVDQTSTINNVTKLPGNFTLYSRYSGSSGVTFNNRTALYGTIYAPDTLVSLAQSFELYGALVADSASLFNSTSVHYDEALSNNPTPFSTTTFMIQNWHERQSNNIAQSPF